MLTGLLRYYNVHQRVFGLAAKLGWQLPGGARDGTSLIFVHAVRFVVAHELSHHVLGHDSAVSAFSPDEHLPVCSDNERREIAADQLALRAVVRAALRELEGTSIASGADQIALLGALVAMVTIHSTEQALLVRRGCSHPPARSRAALLVSGLDPRQQNFAAIFLGDLLTATDRSSTFAPSSLPIDYVHLAATPEVDTPHSLEYLRNVGALDALQCRTDVDLLEIVRRASLGLVADGAEAIATGDIRRGLLTWGFTGERTDQLLDANRALAFHSLYESLRRCFDSRGLPEAELVAMPLAGAQLVANAVRRRD